MPNITHYDLGDYWIPQATFTVAGTPTDPTTLTVKQQAPDGTETVLANAVDPSALNSSSSPVAKTSTGVFKLNPGVAITSAGRWYVKFTGTGTAAASETYEAIGDPDVFTSESGLSDRALVTLAEAKDWLNQQNISTAEDMELVRVINDVSDRMHQEAGREFKAISTGSSARVFPVEPWGGQGFVEIGDAATVTSVEILDTDWATVLDTVDSTDWVALPRTRQAWEPIRRVQLNYRNGVARLRWGQLVRVTGTWGFPQVPGNVRQATLDAVAAIIDRDVEHYKQDLGFSDDAAGRQVLQVTTRPMFLSLPPHVLAVAWSYRDVQVA